jgi:uncharacterized protein YqhQ
LRHESCHASSEHKYTFILSIVLSTVLSIILSIILSIVLSIILCIFLAEIEVVAAAEHIGIGVLFIGFTICEIHTADIATSEAMIETDRLSV